MQFKKIELDNLCEKIDPVVSMRNKWFLVTAESNGTTNTLTAGWGALGNVWEKKTLTVYIRPQRHTKKFMDESGRFTATFFDGYQKELLYLGTHSGADEPEKIKHSGLHLIYADGQPTFSEGKIVLICKTLYKQAFEPECFVDKNVMEAAYPDKDYSIAYIAEIEAAYEIQE
ncbi:MAG TPA: flavin reductase [Clostridiales bacterium]|nr:flavin reductase [Clostridiales bacterium]